MTTVELSATGTPSVSRSAWRGRAGISGIVFGPLLAVSAFMTAGLPHPDHASKVQAWVVKHHGLLSGSALVSVAGVIIGVYFLTYVHSVLTRRDPSWMGTMFLVGTVIFATAGTVSAGLNASLGADGKHLSTDSIQLMASLEEYLNYGMVCIGLAVLYLGAGNLIRRSGILPGWLAWASWLLAVCAASFILGFVALMGMLLWAVVVGGVLMARRPDES